MEEKDFFTQQLLVGNKTEHSWDYCAGLCNDKIVLHIGCSDWPIFNKDGNLHIHLSKIAKDLHGLDPNGIDELEKHVDGFLFKSIFEVEKMYPDPYDVILAPNIFEHLENPGEMVLNLFELLEWKKLFVLVPNYKVYEQSQYKDGVFTEKIHPDHYCWYSPYTLYNLFKKYIEKYSCDYEMNFFDDKNMISILITRKNG